jgi:teichuronic acid biosynthesis glycosyltransferase TuaH
MKIIFLSHSAKGQFFRVGSHHLARELAATGNDVAHISTPVSWAHLLKDRNLFNARSELVNRKVRDQDDVLHLTYRTMFPIALLRHQNDLRKCVIRAGFDDPDVVFIDQPLMNFQRLFPNSTVIYRPTDIHPDGVMHKREQDIVSMAHGVVATSEVVLTSLSVGANVPTLVLENGVETGRFSSAAPMLRSGAVYIGAVDHRFDWSAINAVATAIGPERVRIAGPIASVHPILESNVDLCGPIPYEEIAGFLAAARIGLLPFNAHELNTSRSPMKYYEYLAAGLFVLGRRTAPLDSRRAGGVQLYDDISEIATLAKSCPTSGRSNDEGRTIAEEFDWAARAEELLDFVRSIGVST